MLLFNRIRRKKARDISCFHEIALFYAMASKTMIEKGFREFFLLLMCTLLGLQGVNGQNYKDELFRITPPYLQTVQLLRTDLELSIPIIKLGSSDQLILRFDDLRGGVKNYSYTFELCTYDWKPSGLMVMEYIDGFERNYIDNYAFSFGTTQRYTHYHVNFPNSDIDFKVSGNYLLRVWEEGNDTAAVIMIPFYIWEDIAGVQESVTRSNLSQFRDAYQRVNFTWDVTDANTTNPYDEIKVVAMQNYRYDNARYDLKPRIISGNKLIYDQTDLLFEAGKEYRRFDTRSLRVQTDRIINIDRNQDGYMVYINVDENRSYKRYFFENDINGRYLIAAELTNDVNLQADYAMVRFSLESPYWMNNGNYYVLGTFNNYTTSTANQMTYDFDRQMYTCDIYLKQGFYNYLYGFVENGTDLIDFEQAEGNYFEAVNDYSLFCYLRDNMRFSDRLIGYKTFSSLQR